MSVTFDFSLSPPASLLITDDWLLITQSPSRASPPCNLNNMYFPLMRIAIYSNAYGPSHGGGGVFIFAIAAALAERHEVFLHLPGEFVAELAANFFPELAGCESIHFCRTPIIHGPLRELRQALYDRRFDAVLLQDSTPPRLTLNRRATILCEFPLVPVRGWRNRLRLRSWRTVLGNSQFTAKWIAQRWGRTAAVLYPPVAPITPLPKKPWIFGAGRFLGHGRTKRQLEMVQLFRELCADGLTGWELHLAGFVLDTEYLAHVRAAAQGLPVHLHLDIQRPELERLYGEASLFWHAVGEGLDMETQPQGMEHFGIVTVEAMSAGCVPVVFAGGGQPEIVGTDGQAGYLWHTREEWRKQTLELIHDTDRRQRLGAAASARVARFAMPPFRQHIAELFHLANRLR
ncbi:MAG: glycosyltransferase family 4 protein [Lentisphaeria bacterium]